MSFREASAIERTGEDVFSTVVPDGWQQGRGAFGGLVLGTLLRAIEAREADPSRRARTLTGELCAPVLPGPAQIQVTVLRRGSNLTALRADLVQGGGVAASATVILAAARRADDRVSPPPPERPEWSAVELVPVAPPLAPVFAVHYEYRPVLLPFSGGKEPIAAGFLREAAPLPALDAAAVVGRLDAWWPAIYNVDPFPRPMATVSFTAELFVDPGTLDPREPLFHRARVHALAEGYALELRELWSAAGLVAANQQTFAILG